MGGKEGGKKKVNKEKKERKEKKKKKKQNNMDAEYRWGNWKHRQEPCL